MVSTAYLQAGATAPTLITLLDRIDEVTITFAGNDIIKFENGADLYAFNVLCPWLDFTPTVEITAGDNELGGIFGQRIPLNLPPSEAGEIQISVGIADITTTDNEQIEFEEGWGEYDGIGLRASQISGKHFQIVKRLFTPTQTGENPGISIAAEGDLMGILLFMTTDIDSDPTSEEDLSITEAWLDIGGVNIHHWGGLTLYGTSRGNDARAQPAKLQQYAYLDFSKEVWDARGKDVKFRTNAGTADAIRVYPIYLIDN